MKRAAIARRSCLSAPAYAQLGSALGKLNKAADTAQQVKDLKCRTLTSGRLGN